MRLGLPRQFSAKQNFVSLAGLQGEVVLFDYPNSLNQLEVLAFPSFEKDACIPKVESQAVITLFGTLQRNNQHQRISPMCSRPLILSFHAFQSQRQHFSCSNNLKIQVDTS